MQKEWMKQNGEEGEEEQTTQFLRTEVITLRLIGWSDSSKVHVIDKSEYASFLQSKLVREWFGNDQGNGVFKYQLYSCPLRLFLKEEWVSRKSSSLNEVHLFRVVMFDEKSEKL